MKLSIMENSKKWEETVDISRFIQEIKKNTWKIALSGIIASVIAYPSISMMSPKYTSTATVLLKAQADNVSPFPQVDDFDSTRSGYYETQYALMQSRIVLEKAVRDLKLDQNPDFIGKKGNKKEGYRGNNEQQSLEIALKTLQKNLSVAGIRTTNLVTVSYESPSPQLSAEIANGVAQAFIDYTLDQKRLKTEKARELNLQKMEEVQKEIAKQKTEIDNFLTKEGLLTFRGIDGFETEQLSIVTNRLADATQRRIAAESLYKEISTGEGASLDNVISLPMISNHAQIQDLRIALIQAQRSLYELRKLYGVKHTKIQEAQAQVTAIHDQMGIVLSELKKGLHQQYLAAQADEKAYQEQLIEQKAIFQKLAEKRNQYNSQKLSLDKLEELYKSLYQRTQELSLSSINADAILYDPAIPAVKPSKPNKMLLLVMVVMLAVVFCLIYVIVKVAMDNSVKTPDQMKKRLGVAVFGEIRNITGVRNRAQARDLITNNPQNVDIIHSIRTQILLNSQPQQTLIIASAEKGEGRSLLASLLASSFSFDQKTLLIDLDFLNNDGLSAEYATTVAAGAAELLRGEVSFDSG
ncbi:capsular biosynthesis protein [Escherichia coli]|nr:capsular biosynthesis protein [Escherichia coli]